MRRYRSAILLAVLVATAAFEGRLTAAAGPRLTAITATDGARPAVLIEATEPVPYATARPDPFTVLVDLRNVAATGYANGFTPRPTSPVGGVAVESVEDADGRPVTRVRVSLVEPVSHRVRSHRNVIVVELDPAAALTAAPAAAVPADAPASQTVLRAIRADAGEQGTTLTLIGSGPLAATRVQRAGADRLFVDLPGVVADVPPVTVVGQGAVER
ncbi:MAG TPA: hypothetical protein VIL25_10750, partial [Vicinamibacterales bacterium]